jgi:hypothetical protein
MVRAAVTAAALGTALVLVPGQAHAASAHAPCVGTGPGCASSLSAAIAAAHNGDTIRIGAGVYRGGVTIDKSIAVVGAGRGRTVIRGGGPVITVAGSDGSATLNVSITGLTVTGGTTTGNGYQASGGGIYIPATANGGVGATVQLSDVAVSGNRATATTTSPSPSGVQCPNGDCPFALAEGGGIANSGRLTISSSVIDDNALDGLLSDADGAGIFSSLGSLTLHDSVVAANRAEPRAIGRFAEGGGLFVESGALLVDQTSIVNNHADLITSWPVHAGNDVIDMNANSGGVHIGDGVNAVIDNTTISGNSISAIDRNGEPAAFDSALLVGDSQVTIRGTTFDHNSVTLEAATTADVGPSGTVVEFDGPALLAHSSITNNTVSVTTPNGAAAASGGLAVFDFSDNPRQVTVSDTVISGNQTTANSQHGSASIVGVGILNNSLLELDRVNVRGNTGTASAPSATAQGGGIWNGPLLSGPPVVLTLRQSTVTANSVSAGPHGQAAGGGIYTTTPVTLDRTLIAANHPDNCTGC